MPLRMLEKGCRVNMRGPFTLSDLSGNQNYDSENDIIFVAKHSKPNIYLYKNFNIDRKCKKLRFDVSKLNRDHRKTLMCKNERLINTNYNKHIKSRNCTKYAGCQGINLIKQIEYDLQQVKKKCIQTRVPKIALLYLIEGSRFILIEDKNDNSGINYIYDTLIDEKNHEFGKFNLGNEKSDKAAAGIRTKNNKKFCTKKSRFNEKNHFKRKTMLKMQNQKRLMHDEDDLKIVHGKVHKKIRTIRQINSNVNR
ncbi:hypothetical protein COBT_002772 [Conglomerata obtusa]